MVSTRDLSEILRVGNIRVSPCPWCIGTSATALCRVSTETRELHRRNSLEKLQTVAGLTQLGRSIAIVGGTLLYAIAVVCRSLPLFAGKRSISAPRDSNTVPSQQLLKLIR